MAALCFPKVWKDRRLFEYSADKYLLGTIYTADLPSRLILKLTVYKEYLSVESPPVDELHHQFTLLHANVTGEDSRSVKYQLRVYEEYSSADRVIDFTLLLLYMIIDQ